MTRIKLVMWYVYFIKSEIKDFLYIGSTNNIDRRLREHNLGMNLSTKAYKPFELLGYVAVRSEEHARRLEKYFKTGSGKAVLKKRILTDEVLVKPERSQSLSLRSNNRKYITK